MDYSFIKGEPALLIKKEKTLAVGDLHIGREFALSKSGIHMVGAASRMGEKIARLCKENNADRVVLLGDVKDSIFYPSRDEFRSILEFLRPLENLEVTIAKGNHDAHLAQILKRIDFKAEICDEAFIGNFAFLHGNTMPSKRAMMKKTIVIAHGHMALRREGGLEKAWLVLKIGKGARKFYPDANMKARLVVVPAFSDLIIGTGISMASGRFIPMLRNNVFDLKSAKIYTLEKKPAGSPQEE